MSYNLEFSMKYCLLLTTKTVIEYMCRAVKGNIPKILKISLQESLILAPIIIPVIFLCNLKISVLCEEFLQNNSP